MSPKLQLVDAKTGAVVDLDGVPMQPFLFGRPVQWTSELAPAFDQGLELGAFSLDDETDPALSGEEAAEMSHDLVTVVLDERLDNGERHIILSVPVSQELLAAVGNGDEFAAEVQRRLTTELECLLLDGETLEEFEIRLLHGEGMGTPVGIIETGLFQ